MKLPSLPSQTHLAISALHADRSKDSPLSETSYSSHWDHSEKSFCEPIFAAYGLSLRWQRWEGSESTGQGKPGEPVPWLPPYLEHWAHGCAWARVCLQGAACWPVECQPSRFRLEHGMALPAACGQRAGDDSEIPGEYARPSIGASFLAGSFTRWPWEITSLLRTTPG